MSSSFKDISNTPPCDGTKVSSEILSSFNFKRFLLRATALAKYAHDVQYSILITFFMNNFPLNSFIYSIYPLNIKLNIKLLKVLYNGYSILDAIKLRRNNLIKGSWKS